MSVYSQFLKIFLNIPRLEIKKITNCFFNRCQIKFRILIFMKLVSSEKFWSKMVIIKDSFFSTQCLCFFASTSSSLINSFRDKIVISQCGFHTNIAWLIDEIAYSKKLFFCCYSSRKTVSSFTNAIDISFSLPLCEISTKKVRFKTLNLLERKTRKVFHFLL